MVFFLIVSEMNVSKQPNMYMINASRDDCGVKIAQLVKALGSWWQGYSLEWLYEYRYIFIYFQMVVGVVC